ncbi:MAG: aldehyde dehydrogenase family protein [Mycobacterium sp.]
MFDTISGSCERSVARARGARMLTARRRTRPCFYTAIRTRPDSYYGQAIPLNSDVHAYTRREPFGVTGHIIAWNYPMQLLSRAVVPAIAAVGNRSAGTVDFTQAATQGAVHDRQQHRPKATLSATVRLPTGPAWAVAHTSRRL